MRWLEKKIHETGINLIIKQAFDRFEWFPVNDDGFVDKNLRRRKKRLFEYLCSVKADERIMSMYDPMPYFMKKAAKSRHRGLVEEFEEFEKSYKSKKTIRLYEPGLISKEM